MGDDDGDPRIWRSGIGLHRVGPEGGRADRKIWFRAEVRGLERMPPTGGGAAGVQPLRRRDDPRRAGAGAGVRSWATTARCTPWRTTACSRTPLAGRCGRSASSSPPANAAKACLRWGGLVFPGGDYDSYRSTFEQNTIFNGRRDTCTAIETDVPIVRRCRSAARRPAVPGPWHPHRQAAGVAEDPDRHRRWAWFSVRCDVDDSGQLPLPSKIVRVSAIHVCRSVRSESGCRRVDAHVRAVMQSALDQGQVRDVVYDVVV